MNTHRITLLATPMLALIASCSDGGESQNRTAAAPAEAGSANMAVTANDPNNPYATAEMQMHERMMAAQGANASETWIRTMIEHHRGAIAMNDVLIALGSEAAVIEKARKTSQDQRQEIAGLERMLRAGGVGGGTSGNANPYGGSEQTMHDRMTAAKGANPSETWIRKMVEHHRGAVEMSNVLVRQGGDAKVLQIARMTAQKQQKEISELERMLGGGDVPSVAPAAAPAAASKPKAPEAAAAPKAKAETKAASRVEPKAAPKAEPKIMPEAAPKDTPKAPVPATCAPEHRAMGHC